jgi:hypothetical protein
MEQIMIKIENTLNQQAIELYSAKQDFQMAQTNFQLTLKNIKDDIDHLKESVANQLSDFK